MAASLSSEAGAAVLLSACLAIWTASFSSGSCCILEYNVVLVYFETPYL